MPVFGIAGDVGAQGSALVAGRRLWIRGALDTAPFASELSRVKLLFAVVDIVI